MKLPISPGWYPDPHAAGQQRWWDGTEWTEHVAPHGPSAYKRQKDPLEIVGWSVGIILGLMLIFIIGLFILAIAAAGSST